MKNAHAATVEGFGDEWARFDQSAVDLDETERLFENYFSLFPHDVLTSRAVGADFGCGSGRWARFVAPQVGTLHLVDPALPALSVARGILKPWALHCRFHHATADDNQIPGGSLDFGYSLGVLHHIPDTESALRACVSKLKPGAPFLLYVYYAFDNRPAWFRGLWKASDLVRRGLSRLPRPIQNAVTDIIAGVVYWPLARLSALGERLGRNVDAWPLSHYRRLSFYQMRNDARDRFGTQLEKRFTRAEVAQMMHAAGLERISFLEGQPYWTAIGYKA